MRPQAPTPGLLIALMWVFQAFSTVVCFAEPAESDDLSWALFFMSGLAALVMAIVLVCKNSIAAKANGWVVIGLDIMVFMVGVLAIMAGLE